MTSPNSPTLKSYRKHLLIVAAGLGMLAYLLAAVLADYDALFTALMRLGYGGIAAVLGLSAINYLLRFIRWHWYLHDAGHAVPMARHALVYLGGFLFTVSPAKAGEAVRGVYLREQGVPYTDSFASLFVERLLDFLAYALLASLIASAYPQYRPFLAVVFAVGVLILLLAGRPFLPRCLECAGRRWPRCAGLAILASQLLRTSRVMLRLRLIVPGLAIGLLAWGAEGYGFYLICEGLDLQVPPLTATSIYAIAGLAGAATFFMPGGIGGMEAVMTALLLTLGATLPVALVATLLCRLATLWFAVFVGFFAMVILEWLGTRISPEVRE